MASGMNRGRERPMTKGLLAIGGHSHAALVYIGLLWLTYILAYIFDIGHPCLLRSIETFQNKVSASQFHVTIL